MKPMLLQSLRYFATDMGIHVSYIGTYCKHDFEWFKEKIQDFCNEIIIKDDHAKVQDIMAHMEP